MIEYSIDFQSPEDAWLTGLTSSVDYLSDSWDIDYLDWQLNVGRDETYGDWHILGWAMGVYLVKLTAWDTALINDDQTIAELFASVIDEDPYNVLQKMAENIAELGLTILYLGELESEFIKRYAQTGKTSGKSL